MVALLWVPYMYQSAQKNSGYITGHPVSNKTEVLHGKCLHATGNFTGCVKQGKERAKVNNERITNYPEMS